MWWGLWSDGLAAPSTGCCKGDAGGDFRRDSMMPLRQERGKGGGWMGVWVVVGVVVVWLCRMEFGGVGGIEIKHHSSSISSTLRSASRRVTRIAVGYLRQNDTR